MWKSSRWQSDVKAELFLTSFSKTSSGSTGQSQEGIFKGQLALKRQTRMARS
ncbi:hypothetical protein [Rubritalea tangerina]|uniref:hypothetical protein n=1 Tax=Rubritalea tangerina TaxID=430798 RepID=UPI003612447A